MTTSKSRVPAPAEFERLLVAFINDSLLAGKATVDRDTRLFEDGYMNSLRILDLIAVVEKTLGRRIPDRAVRLANFRTIATIVAAFHPDAVGTDSATAAAPAERLFERRGNRSRFAWPIDALVASGALRVTGAGQVALAGVALEVLDAVDRTVVGWARSLGASEQRYPSLIDAATLERAGRIDDVTRIVPSLPPAALGTGVVRNDGVSSPAEPPPGATHALAPAVCYHAYPGWGGRTLGAAPEVLTAVGRCYRHEDGNYVPLERLWDFTMREIIVVGTRDQVESCRRTLIERVGELVTHLDLDASIEPATDPFFAAGDEGRKLMQQAAALKHELRLAVDATGRRVAAASFNHHADYFGTRFDFRLTTGDAAHSGCVAFGLERWVLAVMAQHGTGESEWPAAVRAWVAGAGETTGAAGSAADHGVRA